MADSNPVITAEGKAKLEQELDELINVIMPEISERIRVARDFGDISENSEYDDAKNEQGEKQKRIDEINRILSEATVTTTHSRSTKVNIGSTVTVKLSVNGGAEKEATYTIVGAAESDVAQNRISNESPVGAALVGRKKDDEVEAIGPTGKSIKMTIIKIEH